MLPCAPMPFWELADLEGRRAWLSIPEAIVVLDADRGFDP